MISFPNLSRTLSALMLTLIPWPQAAEASGAKVDFAREIRPILSNYCFHCHGPDEKNRKGGDKVGLRLDEESGARMDLGGYAALVPNHPERSHLIQRIESTDSDEVMPPLKSGKKMTPREVGLLKRWIEQGGGYAPHWAYASPVRVEPPSISDPLWGGHPVDRFLFARLASEGLKPNPRADRATLARRVMLDLTGLPPSLEELDAFEKDLAPDAYTRFVDKALSKSSFGEHWARMWLDLARYADSAGYPSDPGRSIWAYRDYVIRSFNQNKRFDQFTVEQLAGDLLPNRSEEQLIATAFHRNTMTNNEGGTVDEEFRNAAVVDRVNTTWSVWMGTSMACAQCHTHKFDPLTQKEYFGFFAVLNQTEDADRRDEAPLHEFYLPEDATKREVLQKTIQELEGQFKSPSAAWTMGLEKWMAGFSKPFEWNGPGAASFRASGGLAVQQRADGSFRVVFPSDRKGNRGEVLSVDLALGGSQLTGLKLASVPDDTLPEKGASVGGKGAFTVGKIRAVHLPGGLRGIPARYVRVELKGAVRPLQISELEVFVGGKNVALGAAARLSATQGNAEAGRAVDGRTGSSDSVAVTTGEKAGDFLEVDLGAVSRVEKIRLTAPKDGGYFLGDLKVSLLEESRKELWTGAETDFRESVKEWLPLGGTELKFRAVYATGTAAGFEPQTVVGLKALDPQKNKNRGWGVGPGSKPQSLTLILDKPIATKPEDKLYVELDQQGVNGEQMLASFALFQTGDDRVETWASTPQQILALASKAAELTGPQKDQVRDFYVRNLAPEAAKERSALASAKRDLAAAKPDTVPVMRELSQEKARETKVQIRGNYLNLGDVVTAGTPAVFPPLREGLSANRLGIAKWIVDPQNPLTARVTANRFWESIFGIGIVRTSEEFGAQGEMPVHPDLLDWLATELVRTGWDVKAFLRLLVTSEAYQQSSLVSAGALEKDPDNRLVSRGPRFRVTGEVVRDQALFVSGLLSSKMFGRPVRPPKPNLGLTMAFGGSNDWVPSVGEDRYRRALYTEWKRSSPYPMFTTFDAPDREVCTIRRGRTNTPLQAFVTLNDPVFVEAAQALARRIVAEGGQSVRDRLQYAFRRVLCRKPTEVEASRLERLLEDLKAGFGADSDRALKMATDPLGPIPKGMEASDLASWVAFSNVLLNLDEVLMRR